MNTTVNYEHSIREYMKANPNGGNLHIVLEDGNLEDHHIQWCIEHAAKEGDAWSVRIGKYLLTLTEEERERIYNES